MKRNIGEYRTFDRYMGNWEVKSIFNGYVVFPLRLDKRKCKHCKEFVFEEENYTFEYIETLSDGKKELHLGISDGGRYVILEEFFGFEKGIVKEVIENGKIVHKV